MPLNNEMQKRTQYGLLTVNQKLNWISKGNREEEKEEKKSE